jgi:hypothetical protein
MTDSSLELLKRADILIGNRSSMTATPMRTVAQARQAHQREQESKGDGNVNTYSNSSMTATPAGTAIQARNQCQSVQQFKRDENAYFTS